MHLLLDLLPQNLPAGGIEAVPHALRLKAAALFRSYAADRPSFARSVLKIAQVNASKTAFLVAAAAFASFHGKCPGSIHACHGSDARYGADRKVHVHSGRPSCVPQGFSLTSGDDVDQPYILRYVRRLIDGQASQQNLTPAIGLIMHFQV